MLGFELKLNYQLDALPNLHCPEGQVVKVDIMVWPSLSGNNNSTRHLVWPSSRAFGITRECLPRGSFASSEVDLYSAVLEVSVNNKCFLMSS